jgi:tRNA 2-selenouridine synthase SelU
MASSASTNSSMFEDAGVSGDAEKDKKESAEKRPEPRVCVVGGRTGVGKTAALLGLRAAGESVIDLEGLAAHSGSAFGWVGRPPEQPTSEHFGNLVAMQWVALTSPPTDKVSAGSNAADDDSDKKAPRWIFVEDEGPHVGKCSVDPGLFARMRHAPLVVNVVASRATRLRTLVEDYANDAHRADPAWQDAMDESVGKLRKRLGNERAEALRADKSANDESINASSSVSLPPGTRVVLAGLRAADMNGSWGVVKGPDSAAVGRVRVALDSGSEFSVLPEKCVVVDAAE